MFEGKMLREAIGTPMRMKERAKSRFAEADPDPFTFANLTTKSFVRSRRAGIRRYLSPLPSGRGAAVRAGRRRTKRNGPAATVPEGPCPHPRPLSLSGEGGRSRPA